MEPEAFASHWNAAQAIAGVQVAVAANSPFFFGKELWRETRIALFEQATDTRPEELKAQGVRPRVWFGERWITSIFDLFEENVRYFPALLPVCEDEDPVETLERGDVPALAELRLHNGTVYRWNRPIYDVVRGRPHLRVENRLLPAGPERGRHPRERGVLLRVDQVADGGRAAGVVADVLLGRRGQPARRRARWHRRARLLAGRGGGAGLGAGAAPVAADGARGARAGGTSTAADRERLLGIIERRCVERTNGAAWQAAAFHRLYGERGLERADALARADRALPGADALQRAGAYLAFALSRG